MTEKKLTSTEAFIKAQSEMTTPSLSSVNPFFKCKYADLAEIKKCTMPSLLANHFAYKQTFGFDNEHWGMFGRVVYHDGTIESESFYPINMNLKAQDKGSEITYARRYVMSAACGVVADDDDDGNAAQKAEPEKKQEKPNFTKELLELDMTTQNVSDTLSEVKAEMKACETLEERQDMINDDPRKEKWEAVINLGNRMCPKKMGEINKLKEGLSWKNS